MFFGYVIKENKSKNEHVFWNSHIAALEMEAIRTRESFTKVTNNFSAMSSVSWRTNKLLFMLQWCAPDTFPDEIYNFLFIGYKT